MQGILEDCLPQITVFFLGKSLGKLIFSPQISNPLSYNKMFDIARDGCLGENILSGKYDVVFFLP